jgi:hypothetical protein
LKLSAWIKSNLIHLSQQQEKLTFNNTLIQFYSVIAAAMMATGNKTSSHVINHPYMPGDFKYQENMRQQWKSAAEKHAFGLTAILANAAEYPDQHKLSYSRMALLGQKLNPVTVHNREHIDYRQSTL